MHMNVRIFTMNSTDFKVRLASLSIMALEILLITLSSASHVIEQTAFAMKKVVPMMLSRVACCATLSASASCSCRSATCSRFSNSANRQTGSCRQGVRQYDLESHQKNAMGVGKVLGFGRRAGQT